jgi:hypothetical protein
MTSPGESQPEPAPTTAQGDDGGQPEVIDTGIGRSPVKPAGIVLLALVILALLVFAVYCLIAVWPVKPAVTGPTTSHVVGIRLSLDQEQRLFVVVAVTGALGGLIHGARSLYTYVGNRILLRSWLLFYLSLPLIGAGLAVLFYLILRGGLVTGTAAQVNFFGFAAVSALVGLFTPEAALKLQQIFTTLLAPTPTERDHLPPGTDPTGEVSPPRS